MDIRNLSAALLLAGLAAIVVNAVRTPCPSRTMNPDVTRDQPFFNLELLDVMRQVRRTLSR